MIDRDRALYGTGRLEQHPDGEWLVTTSGDRSGRLYPGTVPRFLDVACQLLAPRPEAQSLKAACEARRK